jgi:hypothetical protein
LFGVFTGKADRFTTEGIEFYTEENREKASSGLPLTSSNKKVVISTEAKRNGEICLDRSLDYVALRSR